MSEKKRTYTTVSVPLSLIEKIDQVIASKKHGYRNRSDFILEAIRLRLRELGFLA